MSVTQWGSENETLIYTAQVQSRTPGDDPGGFAESSGIRIIRMAKKKVSKGKKN